MATTPKATKAELAAALNEREARINQMDAEARLAEAARKAEKSALEVKLAEAELAAADVKSDRDEIRGFLDKAQRERGELQRALTTIFNIHKPFADVTGITLFGMGETSEPGKMALRCSVCKTPEHHTWGNDNSEIWPCATLRTFLQLAHQPIDPPANTPENGDPSSDGVSSPDQPATQQSIEDRFITRDRDANGNTFVFNLAEGDDGGTFWGYGHQDKNRFVLEVRRWQRHCGFEEDELPSLDEKKRVEHLWARYDDQDRFELWEMTSTEADAFAFPVTRLWL